MANIQFNDATGKAGYISEIKLPGQSAAHVLKDAAARTTLNTLSSAIESIEAVTAGAVLLCGKTKTQMTDGLTTAAVVVDGAKTIRGVAYADGDSYTPTVGDAFLYGSKEFIWDGTRWNEFGDLTGLEDFAFVDEGTVTLTPSGTVTVTLSSDAVESTGSFTPTGTISVELAKGTVTSTGSFTPSGSINVELETGTVTSTGSFTPTGTISVELAKGTVTSTGSFTPTGTISVELDSTAGSTATVKNPTSRTVLSSISEGTLPSLTTSVADEVLTLDFSAGAMPTGNTCESITTEDVTVKTGDVAYSVKSQTFSGTQNQSVSVTTTDAATAVQSATFSGTQNQTISVTGTAATGTVSTATFTGTEGQAISVTTTDAATAVQSATFSGTQNQTISVTGTMVTGVSSATFGGNELTATVYPKNS